MRDRVLWTCLYILASRTLLSAQGDSMWNSQLLPKVNGSFSPHTVHFANRDWSLDDFSYVGYFLGAKPLGSVSCSNVAGLTATTGDITAALQSAVDTVGKAGGGIVRIPAGTFTMTGSIAVPYNNVSIEGAGSGQTKINVPSNYASQDDPYDGLFTFGKSLGTTNTGWTNKGAQITTATSPIARGAMQFTAADASKIAAGDWIVIEQRFWQALVDRNSGQPDHWIPNTSTEFSFIYLRQVTAKSGAVVSVDAPIPWTLDPANNAIRIFLTDGAMKENIGLKGVTIRFANNTLASTGRPHGTAAHFEGVRNGWLDDVQVFNFPRFGLSVHASARITILDCWVQTAQDYGGNSYGYGYLVDPAQNILIKRCHGEDGRHNFITSHSQTSMVVMTQSVSVNATQPDDTHFAFEQAILWDKHTQKNGESLEALNRGDESSGAYETIASGAIWNFFGDGVQGRVTYGGAMYLKPSPDGQMIVVGVNGAHQVYDDSKGDISPFVKGQLMSANAGLQVGSDPGALQNVLYEGLYQQGLQPASLYETQLANRLVVPGADWIDVCGPAPTITPNGVTNAASFASGPVSAGEIVTIFGAGMGPAILAGAAFDVNGRVSNTIAGTRVLFDNFPAPLIYSRADVVSAVVPYGLAGRVSTNIVVEYLGQRSAPFPVAVVATTPAIFDLDTSGGVSKWVFNADGSLNSPSNPTAPGATVYFYATGAGQTDPAGVDGSVSTAPYPAPVGRVVVTIGGLPADLSFAQSAPGFVAGVLQINARVPDGLTPGAAPLSLIVGATASLPGPTVSVR